MGGGGRVKRATVFLFFFPRFTLSNSKKKILDLDHHHHKKKKKTFKKNQSSVAQALPFSPTSMTAAHGYVAAGGQHGASLVFFGFVFFAISEEK